MAGKPIALVNPITPTDQETKKCGLIEADADLRKPLWSRCHPAFTSLSTALVLGSLWTCDYPKEQRKHTFRSKSLTKSTKTFFNLIIYFTHIQHSFFKITIT